jgi:hypothetical protein
MRTTNGNANSSSLLLAYCSYHTYYLEHGRTRGIVAHPVLIVASVALLTF